MMKHRYMYIHSNREISTRKNNYNNSKPVTSHESKAWHIVNLLVFINIEHILYLNIIHTFHTRVFYNKFLDLCL